MIQLRKNVSSGINQRIYQLKNSEILLPHTNIQRIKKVNKREEIHALILLLNNFFLLIFQIQSSQENINR